MTKYKRIDAKNGRPMFYIDGTLASIKDVPDFIQTRLEEGVELEISNGKAPETVVPEEQEQVQSEEPKTVIDDKFCFIDGEPSTHKRFLQLVVVGLCAKHYHELNSGKTVQLMREMNII